jgi:Tol biopolymer transport system component/DNA-binding winged helix-turn-helix (wHTH) protein
MNDAFAMNDRAAADRAREIVLSREPPFRLADTAVRPASLEVEFQSETVSLEPRVMQVLVALRGMRGEPVSRDVLIQCCWAGRVVTDGALNRSIAQLRKALRDPGIQIETIPTVGYRLRAVSEEPLHATAHAEARLAAAQSPSPMSSEMPSIAAAPPAGTGVSANVTNAFSSPVWRRRRTLVAVGAAAGLALVVASVLLLTRPVIWMAFGFRPLTATAEQETFPALSPDGAQIVYSARTDAYSARDLYLRNVEDGTPVRLTSDGADEYGAAWSADGRRIAFVRARDDRPCALVVMPVPPGPERVVTHCQTSIESRPSWLNERTLVFSDRLNTRSLPRIRAVDIDTGVVRDLTSPPLSTMGDSDPQAAPDGQHIAWRRMLTPGADELVVLDVRSGSERAATSDGWKASGYVWSADSRHIFFSSNRGGDFGLWSVDRDGGAPPRRVSLGLGTVSFTRMSADRENRIAVELVRGQSKLARLSDRGQAEFITAGAGADSYPAVSADGAIVHVSNRGGMHELWLLNEGAAARRLTSIGGSYVLEPSWSRDGARIVFVGVKGRSAQIYTVSRDGTNLRQLTHESGAKRDPVFSASGDRVLYLAHIDGRWRLMERDAEGRASPRAVPEGDGWFTLRSAPDGTVFGRREGEASILRLTPLAATGSGVPSADEVSVAPLPRISDIDSWTVGRNGIYVRRTGRINEVPSLWFFPWLGSAQKLADVPLAWGNIAVDEGGHVLFSQSTNPEVDLAMVELKVQD